MSDLLQDALEWLDRCGITYMVVGSVASSVYGLARATQDIDVVVEISANQVRRLAAMLPDDRYYISAEAGLQAEGKPSEADLVVSCTLKEQDTVFLIHLEHQARRQSAFAQRIYELCSGDRYRGVFKGTSTFRPLIPTTATRRQA